MMQVTTMHMAWELDPCFKGNGISYGFFGSNSKRTSSVCGTGSILLGTYSIIMVLNYESNVFVLQQVVN